MIHDLYFYFIIFRIWLEFLIFVCNLRYDPDFVALYLESHIAMNNE
jgi:hypothetical protein